MAKITKIIFSFIILTLLVSSVSPALAFTIKTLPGLGVTGDFALSTGKIELALNPGDSVVRNITITNRIGKDSRFKIEIEDFGPSDQEGELTKLYGNEMGPYSLKKYLVPEINEFTLKQGEQISIAIAVSIPADAPAGGLYGCALISNIPEPTPGEGNKIQGQVGLASRLGVLFFVKINGQTVESGSLTSFNSLKSLYTTAPVKLQYAFNNDGNIYLTPQSTITIKNMFNSTVGEVKTDPFFVLPKFERKITEEWSNKFMLGRYTATISLNRGYGDNNIDTKTISFWVVPIPVIIIIASVILILILIIIWERRKKKKKLIHSSHKATKDKKNKK
jgi:hypothetical protein